MFLNDHLNKENKFFDDAEADVLTREEEADMYEEYRSVFAIVKKIDEMIAEIDWLESRDWNLRKIIKNVCFQKITVIAQI